MTVTHWLEYGEPIDDGMVEATHKVVRADPSVPDKIHKGKLPMDKLKLWDLSNSVHTDGSLELSAAEDDIREALEQSFVREETFVQEKQ